MGISERRKSSSILRVLTALSLVLPCPTLLADPPPLIGETQDDQTNPHTEVRLPPGLDTLLLGLLDTSTLNRPGAVEFPGHRNRPRTEKLYRMKILVGETPRVYGNVQAYVGEPIDTLERFVDVREPTRAYGGSVRKDFEQVFRRMEAGTMPVSASVSREQFANTKARISAELYEFDRTLHVQKVLDTLREGSLHPTIVGRVLTGALGLMFTTGGAVQLLRTLQNSTDIKTGEAPTSEPKAEVKPESAVAATVTAPAPAPQAEQVPSLVPPPNLSSKQRRQWYAEQTAKRKEEDQKRAAGEKKAPEKAQAPAAPSNSNATAAASVAAGGSLLTMAAVGQLAGRGADAIEQYQKAVESEQQVIDFIGKLDRLKTAEQAQVLSAFETQINDTVVPQLYQIGRAAAQSPQIQAIAAQDPRVHGLIEVFFEKYPKLLPSDVIKDMIMGLLRAPVETTDYQSLQIVLSHYGTMAKQFFQNICETAGMGAFAKVIVDQRDNDRRIPFDVIERIIQEDPNHYRLSNINPIPVKTGKAFQVHYADYTNDAGEVVPVAVRVLKPGVEQMLEVERVILQELAPDLAVRLGLSVRRVKELVDMIYENHRREIQVDLTVFNQNEAAKRINRQIEVDIRPLGKKKLNIFVPHAYAALPGSHVMVMDRVMNIADLGTIRRFYPDLPRYVGEALLDMSVENLLIAPMQEAAKPKARGEQEAQSAEQRKRGLMHVDPHPGNILFQVPGAEIGVAVVDFGLTEWVEPQNVSNIAMLAIGASYNSTAFLEDALWSMRSPKMDDLDARAIQRAKEDLAREVREQAYSLHRQGKFWSPAQWVKHLWSKEIVDYPGWLIAVEQGYQATSTTYHVFGHSKPELDKHLSGFQEKHWKLFYEHVKKRNPRHPGWGPIYRKTAWTWCSKHLLPWSGQTAATN